MNFSAKYIPYQKAKSFSSIVLDYLNEDPSLRPFYAESPTLEGIRNSIQQRKDYQYPRAILHSRLNEQYKTVGLHEKVKHNIDALLQENTFTVCTAHQPNIFTGHLYFIYKIIHATRLADELNEKFAGNYFVPVYYMGSEDADLEELGEISINGKKYEWKTRQQGAVGRMKVDKAFLDLVAEIEGQLAVEPWGEEILALVKKAYTEGKTIEQATFDLVNGLFSERGLVILLPDHADLKRTFQTVVKKELEERFSHRVVKSTVSNLPGKYQVQAAGRELNLFYLKDDVRERIETMDGGFRVANTGIKFTGEQIFSELADHPDRFSPNVILRPVFQEMILPNIAFIGGGGEIAYWLELLQVFREVNVPFPVLVLRNSFMIVTQEAAALMEKLNLGAVDFFNPAQELIDDHTRRATSHNLSLADDRNSISGSYDHAKAASKIIDPSLERHVEALKTQALNRMLLLEKKMLRAERKKFEAAQRQILKVKNNLFPGGTLQERVDNLLPFYARWGSNFLDVLYHYSRALDMEFCILEESDPLN